MLNAKIEMTLYIHVIIRLHSQEYFLHIIFLNAERAFLKPDSILPTITFPLPNSAMLYKNGLKCCAIFDHFIWVICSEILIFKVLGIGSSVPHYLHVARPFY